MQNKKISIILATLILHVFFVPNFSFAASSDPLIYANNLVYQGAFRLPVGDFGPAGSGGFSYGGGAITYNADNDSLFFLGHGQHMLVSEINIPAAKMPNSSSDVTNLNTAAVLQNFSDITEGNLKNIGQDGVEVINTSVNIGGLLKYNDKLIGTSFTYYDSIQAKLSHFTSGLTLNNIGDFSGMFKVGNIGSSFVSGWMTKVPDSLQNMLGGPALTGNGTLSVLSRTSLGPSAFVFNPDRLGIDNPVSATPLFYYPQGHESLGPGYANTSPSFNGTTKIAGISMINGSRSILFFGFHGIGPYNYGQWATDPIYADTCKLPDQCIADPRGWNVCSDPYNCTTGRKGIPNDPLCMGVGTDGCFYDPTGTGGKGPNAYPYIYQAWAYDANDVEGVIAGTKNPWDVFPYAMWTLPFTFQGTPVFGGAAAYDPSTHRLFVVQPNGDRTNVHSNMPLVHVFNVDLNNPAASNFKIKVKAMLLKGTIILKNNDSDELIVTANDRTTLQDVSFPISLNANQTYNVTIAQQPEGQTCQIINGSGTVNANADISNIVLTCEGSGVVKYSFQHFLDLFQKWHNLGNSTADINYDGKVNVKDLGKMMSNWN